VPETDREQAERTRETEATGNRPEEVRLAVEAGAAPARLNGL